MISTLLNRFEVIYLYTFVTGNEGETFLCYFYILGISLDSVSHSGI